MSGPSLTAVQPSANLSIHNEIMVGWVAGPHTRGTMSLLLSCLTTIFLCTWTVLHLDVPRNDEKRTMVSMFRRKAIWMTVAIIAPEFMVSIAVHQFVDAWRTRKALSSKGGGSKWSLTQAFFLHMGGILYMSSNADGCTATSILTEDGVEELLGTSVGSQSEATLKFEDLPSDATILDKSKSDCLAKSLALLQCAWFVSQVIARAIDSLPITTLELGTTALIGCASVAYGFWWFKPQEVRTPIEIRSLQRLRPTADDIGGWRELDPLEKPISLLAFALATVFVGGIHCAAWNFFFPTPIERLLWRIASILVLVLPLLEVLVLWIDPKYMKIVDGTFMYIVPGLYAIFRLFLIIAMFVSLRGVPGGVYHQLPWSDFIPHL